MQSIFLSNGSWKAQVIPDCAMNVISLTYMDEEILNKPAAPQLLLSDPFIYGTPLLFPPNRLRGNSFNFENAPYSIPYEEGVKFSGIHGKLTRHPTVVDRLSESIVEGHICCGPEQYPFPCELAIEIRLESDGLYVKHTVKNKGEGRMPFAIGFHTTFAAKGAVKVSAGREWILDDKDKLPVKLAQTDTLEWLRSGVDPTAGSINVMCTDNGRHTAFIGEYQYSLSDNFTDWVVWNMDGTRGFISLEPQSSPADGLNMSGKFNILEPGEQESFYMRISCAGQKTG